MWKEKTDRQEDLLLRTIRAFEEKTEAQAEMNRRQHFERLLDGQKLLKGLKLSCTNKSQLNKKRSI